MFLLVLGFSKVGVVCCVVLCGSVRMLLSEGAVEGDDEVIKDEKGQVDE